MDPNKPNVHRVEFDEDVLYVILRGHDITNTIGEYQRGGNQKARRVYEVELYHCEQLGEKILLQTFITLPVQLQKERCSGERA